MSAVFTPATYEPVGQVLTAEQYDDGGIPHYWRVELEPELVIHTYRLELSRSRTTGGFGVGATVAAPGLEWATVAVSDLIA